MKFFVAFAALLALASAYQPIATWSLQELSDALEDPSTDPAIVPYLEAALNKLIESIFSGTPQTTITVSIPTSVTYSLQELDSLMSSPETNPALMPYLVSGLNVYMTALFNGQNAVGVTIHFPAMNVNTWSLEQLSFALRDPATDPALHVYLEYALNHLMEAIFDGQTTATVDVVTPPGLNAVPPVVPDVSDYPVFPGAVIAPEAAPAPALVPAEPNPIPAPAAVPDVPAASSPLVQLIVNVNV